MAKELSLPLRTIHLDFHTSPHISDVASRFDAEAFARTFAQANVDSVCLFAKCHHGHLYYGTDHPARHPGLPPGLDLLARQVEALHRHGIQAPLYLSVQCDEYAANTHPEWLSIDVDGRPVRAGGPLGAGWHVLDMSSPYQDYLAEQLDEVLETFSPVDGVFFDMCWDQPSLSRYAVDGMRRRGYDPEAEDDRRAYARQAAHVYMGRFRRMVDDAVGDRTAAWVWFNSRPKLGLGAERAFVNHVNVECLPTGGWGYAYYPYVARYVRSLGLPAASHTGRFHKSWGDFGGLKPEAALRYECCLTMSQGMSVGVGDQMHPRGTLDAPAYDMVGRVFGYVKACEPWTSGGRILSDVAAIVDPGLGDNPGPVGLGITRMLQELRCQFDLLPPSADIASYPLAIVTDLVRIDARLRARLRDHLARGGALIVSGAAALDEGGGPAMEELGITSHGDSPFSVAYLTPEPALAAHVPDMPHAIYERTFRMKAGEGAQVLCGVTEPYFERSDERFCSHGQTPPGRHSPFAAAAQSGRVITFSFPLFTAYGKHASLAYRQLLRGGLDRLLPEPLIIDKGPACLETSVVRMKGWTTVHCISYCPVRKTDALDIVEDPLPLVDMPLSLRLPKAPARVYLAPSGRELPFEYRAGRAHVRVTCLDGHTMVVFEDAG